MNNVMTCYSPAVNKPFLKTESACLTGVQAETHLDEFCPEWVYSHKTRRDVIETLTASGYQPDFEQLSDGSVAYRLAALDGRYFSVTETMFNYAVSQVSRDTKGFYVFKKSGKGKKGIANNHEMAYS